MPDINHADSHVAVSLVSNLDDMHIQNPMQTQMEQETETTMAALLPARTGCASM